MVNQCIRQRRTKDEIYCRAGILGVTAILVLSNNYIFFQDKKLQENREARRADWQGFINDMSSKCRKVDQTFQEKEQELKEFYIDLERKLHIDP